VLLCVIYVLGPYIATVVLGDPVRGQAIISQWQSIAGLIVALTAPFLGAAADRMGHRKPLLAIVVAIMAPAVFVQWWALPGGAGLPFWALGASIIVAGVCYTWTEVLHNSLLTTVAKPTLVSPVSGLGLALGNATSLALLIFVLVAFALPGVLPGLPAHPLFGLNPATHETSRIVAPISAVCLVVLALPLFLFAPDRNPTGESLFAALRDGVAGVARTIVKLRQYGNTVLFLIARMIYVDGKIAVIIFGGIYASGTLHWHLIEMLGFGVTLSAFAVFGGLVSAWLDRTFGLKRAVAIEIAVTFVCLMTEVSISPAQIFFITVDSHAIWGAPIFRTLPEVVYLGASALIAVSITAAFASSRAMMARLAPEGMEGEIFGLYALSGTASGWLAPSLVAIFTAATQTLRAGFASIGILLVVGFVLLLFVKPPARIV
jgi:UMF1 family MFS transporter